MVQVLERQAEMHKHPAMGDRDEDFSSFPRQRILPAIRRTGPGLGWEVAHDHPELEFNLVISGRGAYFLEDRQYELKPGTLVWLLPFQKHRMMRGPDLDLWVAALSPDHYSPELLEEAAHHPIKQLSAEDAVALDRLYTHLSQDADTPSVYALGLKYAVHSTMHAAKTSAGAPPPVRHPAVVRALALLREGEDVDSLSQLAKACAISPKHLGDLLVAQTGRGFVDWRNIARLEKFQDIYPQSRDLLNAALAAGFGSYTQFHRVFQDLVGITPGAWSKKREEDEPIHFPQMSQAVDQMRPGSQRLIWLSLAGASFAAAGQWMADTFEAGLLAPPALLEEGEPIPSGVDNFASLHDLQPRLIDELCSAYPDKAGRIREILSEIDLLEQYVHTLANYGADAGDISSVAAIALAIITMEANYLMMPNMADVMRLRASIRRFGRRSATEASAEQRREIVAGLVAQSMILTNASHGTRASGVTANASRTADAVQEFCLRVLKTDLRAMPLYGLRSPLSAIHLIAADRTRAQVEVVGA